MGLIGVRFEDPDTGSTALKVRSGAGRHWYDGGTVFSAGTNIDDANTPTVVYGLGFDSGTSVPNRLDDLKLNENLFVGEGTQAEDRILHIAAPSGQVRDTRFYSGDPDVSGTLRWILRVNNTGETGSNAGSNLELIARDDTGGNLGAYLTVERSDGTTRFFGDKMGFFGAVEAGQQVAPASLTDNSGGTKDDTVEAVSGSGADAAINNNFAELTEELNQVRQALVNLGLWA